MGHQDFLNIVLSSSASAVAGRSRLLSWLAEYAPSLEPYAEVRAHALISVSIVNGRAGTLACALKHVLHGARFDRVQLKEEASPIKPFQMSSYMYPVWRDIPHLSIESSSII
eukprot:956218-Pleurochrysis_carterae.AAC.2